MSLTPFFPKDFEKLGLLKFELLVSGLRISQTAHDSLATKKRPIRTRSGTSGGLDLVLPNEIYVNCPVDEDFSKNSELILDFEEDSFAIKKNGEVITKAGLMPLPNYYGLESSDGTPLVKIGQMCSGDRFCYGMTGPYCWFWKPQRRCKYCSIGLNAARDYSKKTEDQLLEALSNAISDPNLPAKHILLGGGTPEGEDMGARLAANLCKVIRKKFDISIYVMICAPLKNEYIDMLKDAGANELGMNIEFYSEEAWKKYIPGKNSIIGKKRYLDALEYSVKVFGPINTRSLIIAGLEERKFTLAGSIHLASMGVMPILSPFRALSGTDLENEKGFDHYTYWDLYKEIHFSILKYGIPTGPICKHCQNNTLALPLPGGVYRSY